MPAHQDKPPGEPLHPKFSGTDAVRPPFFLLEILIHTGLARWLPGVRRHLGGGIDILRYYTGLSPMKALCGLRFRASG
jgi:hypothetical protein